MSSKASHGAGFLRVDDFIKLLVGLVVGQFLRDAHRIGDHLALALRPHWLGEAFPFILVAFVIRNVHASLRFDSWVAARNFVPECFSSVKGRVFSFVAGLLALFVSTFSVEHFLAEHLAEQAGTDGRLSMIPADRVPMLTVFLILPFAVYLAWDLGLWLATDVPEWRKDKIVQRLLRKWVVMDAVGFGWLLVCLLYQIIQGSSPDGGLEVTIIGFAVLAISTVVYDYFSNVSFYFAGLKYRAVALVPTVAASKWKRGGADQRTLPGFTVARIEIE